MKQNQLLVPITKRERDGGGEKERESCKTLFLNHTVENGSVIIQMPLHKKKRLPSTHPIVSSKQLFFADHRKLCSGLVHACQQWYEI